MNSKSYILGFTYSLFDGPHPVGDGRPHADLHGAVVPAGAGPQFQWSCHPINGASRIRDPRSAAVTTTTTTTNGDLMPTGAPDAGLTATPVSTVSFISYHKCMNE